MMHKSKRGRGPVATAAYSAKRRLDGSEIEEEQELTSFCGAIRETVLKNDA